MRDFIFVFLGGGIGSVLRYGISLWINKNGYFPWHTLLANIIGCTIIGLLMGYFLKNNISWLSLLVITGFCGGFTTFSTFSIETFHYLKGGEIFTGICYAFISLTVCIFATGIGYYLTSK